jgi:hypothetical protein
MTRCRNTQSQQLLFLTAQTVEKGMACQSCRISRLTNALYIIVAILAGSWGCTGLNERASQQLEEAYGTAPPTIDSTFASKTILPRSVWRIYLNASDPDGDIQYAQFWVEVPWNTSPFLVKVNPEQDGSLSGYFEFDMLWFLNFAPMWIRVQVTLEDKAKHKSELVEYVASISASSQPDLPPKGLFQQRFLGRIPAELMPTAF